MRSTAQKIGEQGFVYLKSGQTPGQRYDQLRAATDEILACRDPRHKTLVANENSALVRLKDVQPGSVQDNRFLANLSVQYKNDEYIGELVMPEVQTPSMAGEYPVYDKRSRFAAPDDSMSGRSTANEVSDGRSFDTYSCKPYALKNHVGKLTLRNQQAPLDEMVDLTEAVADDIALRREIRIATVATTAASYPTGNKVTLTAGNRFDDPGSDVISALQTAGAALFRGRGASLLYGAMSLEVWNALSRHPQILDLLKYTRTGMAKPDELAGFFGWDGVLVSAARNDTANEGQTASYSRIWGKFCWVGRVAKRASIRNAAFGSTFRFGPQLTRVWYDEHQGTEGGYYAQVSTHEDHKVVAADTAYLISSAIA